MDFSSFSVNNFNNDPSASYFGNLNPIICMLHLLSWIDPSIRFHLKATCPDWLCAYEKKKIPPHTFLPPSSSEKLTLLSTHCDPFCCHWPCEIYIAISFILCFMTNIWQQLLGLTWLYKLTKSIKSLWISNMPNHLNVHLST